MSQAPNNASTSSDAYTGRTLSTAYRFLSGTGCASLLAYQMTPDATIEFCAHGLTRSGMMAIAYCPDDDDVIAAQPDARDIPVRLDIVRSSAETSVQILSGAVHLMGTLGWISRKTAVELAEAGELPPRVAEIAVQPRGKLGFIKGERVLLHDSTGVTPIRFAQLASTTLPPMPAMDEEFDAYDAVQQLNQDRLWDLCEAISLGIAPGNICSQHEEGAGCAHIWNSTYCVDVDSYGITLMRVEPEMTTTFFAAFDEQAHDLDQLRARIAQLSQHCVGLS